MTTTNNDIHKLMLNESVATSSELFHLMQLPPSWMHQDDDKACAWKYLTYDKWM